LAVRQWRLNSLEQRAFLSNVQTASEVVNRSCPPAPLAPEPAESGSMQISKPKLPFSGVPSPTPQSSGTPAKRGLSIFQKLLFLILLLVIGIVLLLAVYFPARQIAAMRSALEAEAQTYGRLVSKQIQPAIAFDDQETAREVFESVAQDPDIDSLTLFTATGAVLRARGTLSSALGNKKTGVSQQEMIVTSERLTIVTPVVSLEGPKGTLVIEVSERHLNQQRRDVLRDAVLAGLLALLAGALGAWLIAASLGRRLRAIANAADSVAGGDLNQSPLAVTGKLDEIGTVTVAFNAMMLKIRTLVGQIRQSAENEQARLESLVAARTKELDARNVDMRQVLDNVGQGFFTLDRCGTMSRERSAVLERWLGPVPGSESFKDLLAQIAPEASIWFAQGWASLLEDIMPLEVSLDQLPKQLLINGLELEIDYRPILDTQGALERVLVVVSDGTAARARARAEQDEREGTKLFTRIIADRAGFLEFFSEAHGLLQDISGYAEAQNRQELSRALHTLKGNAGIYGIETVAQLAHGLEDQLAEQGAITQLDLIPLQQRWSALATKVRALVGDQSAKIEIDDLEYRQILEAIEHGRPLREIRQMIEAWRLEPTQMRLSRLAEQVSALAERQNKGPVETLVESNQIRLSSEEWSSFWGACIHLLRNSVDHGLEPAEEREELGKSVPAKLTLRTTLDSERFTIEVGDDGRGIDWEAVRAKANSLGLPATSHQELVAALFADGLSTRAEVSELSGRGVGLGAVLEECRRLGGTVEVVSVRGQGSTFRFVWPSAIINGFSGATGGRSKRISISVGLKWAGTDPLAQ
jgi:two-component system, chemotaxis family, sensor kinase CheA